MRLPLEIIDLIPPCVIFVLHSISLMDAHAFLCQICCPDIVDGNMIFCIPGLTFLGENCMNRIFVLVQNIYLMICLLILIVCIVDLYIYAILVRHL